MMTSRCRIASMFAAAAIAAAGFNGCTAQPQPGGAVRYRSITGELTATLDAPLDRVWGAAQGAVEELQFRSQDRSKDAITGILRAKTADNSDIRIRLDKRTEGTTDVNINVGTFGNESTARLIMDKIKARL
jgi:hypothetical protein